MTSLADSGDLEATGHPVLEETLGVVLLGSAPDVFNVLRTVAPNHILSGGGVGKVPELGGASDGVRVCLNSSVHLRHLQGNAWLKVFTVLAHQTDTGDEDDLVALVPLEAEHVASFLGANVGEVRREGLEVDDGAEGLGADVSLQVLDELVVLFDAVAHDTRVVYDGQRSSAGIPKGDVLVIWSTFRLLSLIVQLTKDPLPPMNHGWQTWQEKPIPVWAV